MEEMVDTFKQQLEAGDENTLVSTVLIASSSDLVLSITQTDEEDEDCFAVSISTRRLATFYKCVSNLHGCIYPKALVAL